MCHRSQRIEISDCKMRYLKLNSEIWLETNLNLIGLISYEEQCWNEINGDIRNTFHFWFRYQILDKGWKWDFPLDQDISILIEILDIWLRHLRLTVDQNIWLWFPWNCVWIVVLLVDITNSRKCFAVWEVWREKVH